MSVISLSVRRPFLNYLLQTKSPPKPLGGVSPTFIAIGELSLSPLHALSNKEGQLLVSMLRNGSTIVLLYSAVRGGMESSPIAVEGLAKKKCFRQKDKTRVSYI